MGKYTQNKCFEVCFQYSYAIPNCDCADPSVGSNVNNIKMCTYGIDQICLNEQKVPNFLAQILWLNFRILL